MLLISITNLLDDALVDQAVRLEIPEWLHGPTGDEEVVDLDDAAAPESALGLEDGVHRLFDFDSGNVGELGDRLEGRRSRPVPPGSPDMRSPQARR
ncbi:MAG: hypothetical protein R2849_10905 [Thermomicrobiales bacterium]